MTFGKDFTQAVEQKQIAQQGSSSLSPSPILSGCTDLLAILSPRRTEAERAKFIVERVRTPPSLLPLPSSLLPLPSSLSH
jgi:hypothetical protein